MTGIVVVSHSAALADAAIALAREMSGGVRMEAAAGVADGFGTDATAIASAMTAADDGQGVVVIMDLGSAIMSAEMALEFLDDELRARVVLCPGPFVEGLVAAAVAAAGGADPSEVSRRAAEALDPKRSDMPVGEQQERSFVLRNTHGLHARPAAKLVAAIAGFDAQVELRNVTRSSDWVAADSLTSVALLGGQPGHTIEMRAAGSDSTQALDAIVALAEQGFGEGALPPVTGSIFQYRRAYLPRPAPGPDEQGRLDRARGVAATELRQARDRVPDSVKEVYDAHLAFLDDVALLRRARVSITVGDSAEDAWAQATEATAADFARIKDPYLRSRAADVRAIGDSVLRALAGVELPQVHGIVVARELNPVEAALFDVDAAALTEASETDHAGMVLRARGVPAVVGAPESLLDLPDGTTVTVDLGSGTVTQ